MTTADTEQAETERTGQAESDRAEGAESEQVTSEQAESEQAETKRGDAKQAATKQAQPTGKAAAAAPAASDDFTGAIGTANERLQEVLRAADRAARQILEDARAEARRHVAEEHERAQRVTQEKLDGLTARAEEIMRQAEAVGRELGEFAATVEAATREVADEYGIEATPPPPKPGSPATRVAAEGPGADPGEGRVRRVSLFRGREAGGERPATRVGTERSQEIVARIAQWKSWGMSRARIEARLVEEFRVRNPAAVLDSLERSRPR